MRPYYHTHAARLLVVERVVEDVGLLDLVVHRVVLHVKIVRRVHLFRILNSCIDLAEWGLR